MRETRNYYTTLNNHADHTTFGGNIYRYDFDGYTSISNITDRIISDLKFDIRCKKNEEDRDRNKQKGTKQNER